MYVTIKEYVKIMRSNRLMSSSNLGLKYRLCSAVQCSAVHADVNKNSQILRFVLLVVSVNHIGVLCAHYCNDDANEL